MDERAGAERLAGAIADRLSAALPPGLEPRIINTPSEAPAVETTLDALDDAISMLSDLNTGARGATKPRRGRIDLPAFRRVRAATLRG